MNVLMVEPGMAPYEKEINGLEEMQAAVGGLITVIYPYKEPVGIVANDEGILLKMEFNRSVEGGYGGIFFSLFFPPPVCLFALPDSPHRIHCQYLPRKSRLHRNSAWLRGPKLRGN